MIHKSCLVAVLVVTVAGLKQPHPTPAGFYNRPGFHARPHRYPGPLHPGGLPYHPGRVHPGRVHPGRVHPGGLLPGYNPVGPQPYGGLGFPGGPGYQDPYHNTPAFYDFEHSVHDDYTGTHFGHSEVRDGHLTEGKYYVHLPDGRLQTVIYYADQTGFHPTITYEGDPNYLAPVHVPGVPLSGYRAP
ncbi:pro-resilin-like [Homarus americanus]|uniref:pro-resilin-like n=1 Tax=Homarus americanus TaxID=6706 RepID=UPI001C45FDF6|nr:pro-resilin-like [Homarus americanus]